MKTTKTRITTLAAALTGLLGTTAALADGPGVVLQGDYAMQCYQETLKTDAGVSASELSTVTCDRALRDRPMNPERKAVILHNRGVVQMQMGASADARDSFERSIKLARDVGMANVALAQLAHSEGEYEKAVELYDEILAAGTNNAALRGNEDLISRNRDRAENGQRAQQIALTR